MSEPPDTAALIADLRHPHSVQPYSTQRQVRDLFDRAAAALAAQARRIEEVENLVSDADNDLSKAQATLRRVERERDAARAALRDLAAEYACAGIEKCSETKLEDGTCLCAMIGRCGDPAAKVMRKLQEPTP